MALVLSRKPNQKIIIDVHQPGRIELMVAAVDGQAVKLTFIGDREVASIRREELVVKEMQPKPTGR